MSALRPPLIPGHIKFTESSYPSMPTLNIYKETFKQQLLVYIQFQEAIAHDTAPSQTPIKTEKRSTTHCRLRQRRAQGLGQHSGK